MPKTRKTSSVSRNAVAGRATRQGEDNGRIRRNLTTEGNSERGNSSSGRNIQTRSDVSNQVGPTIQDGNSRRLAPIRRRSRISGRVNSNQERNGQMRHDVSNQVGSCSLITML